MVMMAVLVTTHWYRLSPAAVSELSNSTPLPSEAARTPTPPIPNPTTRGVGDS